MMQLVSIWFFGLYLLAFLGLIVFRKHRLMSGVCLIVFAVLSAGLLVTFLNQFTD